MRQHRTMGHWPRFFGKLSMLCVAAMLSACGSLRDLAAPPAPPPITRIVEVPTVERLTLPPDLLTCAEAPAPPGDGATQRDAALWVADLHAAHADCAARLAAVRARVNPLKEMTP